MVNLVKELEFLITYDFLHYTPTRAVIEGVLYSIYFVAVTLLFQLLAMFSCFTMYAICQPALDTRKQFVIHRIVSLAIINRLFPMLNTIWLKQTT